MSASDELTTGSPILLVLMPEKVLQIFEEVAIGEGSSMPSEHPDGQMLLLLPR